MATGNKQGKMANYMNYRMRVTLADTRQIVGQMLAYDKHMNIVLADSEEYRRIKKRSGKTSAGAAPLIDSEEKRTLGLVILRGANIISLSVESGPPPDPAARLGVASGGAPSAMAAGPGVARSAGRGMPVGLQGPAAGVGGGFGGFGGPGGPPGFGRGGPPPGGPPGFGPPGGFPGPPGGGPPGFGPPAGFPGQGRGFPPAYGGR